MQQLQDLQDKIFFESKNILETLAKINSKEDLLNKQDLFSELTDRISFLLILEKNRTAFDIAEPVEEEENMSVAEPEVHLEDEAFEEDLEEEVMFTNELNEMESVNAEILKETEENQEFLSENESEVVESEEDFQEEIPLIIENEDPGFQQRKEEQEKLLHEQEERRRQIVEFTKAEHYTSNEDQQVFENKTAQETHEKKFKLAHIKGLKSVQQIFDEDPLEKIEEKTAPESTGSILKTNVPTEFMEAAKQKPQFKLDLNDRVAFTKVLFHGDEAELKKTIDQLNSYDDLEEARKYLSEIYYEKNWKKSDEYAQRLWSLVENKFF